MVNCRNGNLLRMRRMPNDQFPNAQRMAQARMPNRSIERRAGGTNSSLGISHSLVIGNWTFFGHWSLGIGHSLVIGHWELDIPSRPTPATPQTRRRWAFASRLVERG